MNKETIFIPAILTIIFIITGCPSSTPNLFEGVQNRDMVAVPAIPAGFSMGYANVSVPVHTVASISGFTIGKNEVTYELWNVVYKRAITNGYKFSNDSSTTATGSCGNSGSGSNKQPVTAINWRDCIVWCNAYSEMNNLQPVYYADSGFTKPLKSCDNSGVSTTTLTQGNEDNPYVKWSANGYRLPTETEWEECARYADGSTWLQGDHVSGDTSGYCYNSGKVDALSTIYQNYAWYNANSSNTKEVGTKSSNGLGLYDMSGNVWEWCWDWYGTYTSASPYTDADTRGPVYNSLNPYRVIRGGSWSSINTSELAISGRGYTAPNNGFSYAGFRVVKI